MAAVHGPAGPYVTTSWDDGHVLDHRLAGLLERYQLPATFYVAPRNVELAPRERLDPAGIRALAERFEIGGHTLNHLRLPALTAARAEQEIRDGKAELEDVIGAGLRSFCYVGGQYRHEHVEMVRRAGFRVARTVRRHRTRLSPALEQATSTHAYRHTVDPPLLLPLTGWRPGAAWRLYRDWDRLAVRLFDRVAAVGGVFHLWGHSWELDARGDWARLERVLAHISGRDGIRYVGNAELPVAPEPAVARER